MSKYLIRSPREDEIIDKSIMNQSQLNNKLKPHHNRNNVYCLCTDPHPTVTIWAHHNGNYYLKRMPNTGILHDKLCHHHSLTTEDVGMIGYTLQAISQDYADDIHVFSLNTPLTATRNDLTDTIYTDINSNKIRIVSHKVRNNMTCLGIMNYLFEKSELNCISDYDDNKSIWPLIRQAATGIRPKIFKDLKYGLSEMLLLPLNPDTPNQYDRNWAKLNDARKKGRNVMFMLKLSSDEFKNLNLNPDSKEIDLGEYFGVNLKVRDEMAPHVLNAFSNSFKKEGSSAESVDDIRFW